MRIVVIGCGRMGSGLAETLQVRGHAVTVVDRDPASFERLGSGFRGRTVVGVGFDRQALVDAGIEKADALAAVTPSDETNVVAARLAKEFFSVPRVVVRLYDPRKAEIYNRLGLQTISPILWGIHQTADMLCYAQVDTVATLGTGGVSVVATEVTPLLVGRTVQSITVPASIHVIAISRGGRTFIPTMGTVFQAGDVLNLTVVQAASGRLNDLLGIA